MRTNHRMNSETWRNNRPPASRLVNNGSAWNGTPMARPRPVAAERNGRLPDFASLWRRLIDDARRRLHDYMYPEEARARRSSPEFRPRRPDGGRFGPFGLPGEAVMLGGIVLAILACLILSVAGVRTVLGALRPADNQPVAEEPGLVAPTAAPAKQIKILLLGMDQRPNDGSYRTDVMLLLLIDPNESRVSVVSIPRDLWVKVPSLYEMKINEVMQMGGWKALAEAYEANFGVKPDYYVMTNFNGFVDFIDNRGGIDVEVAQTLTDACDLVWQKGGFCTADKGSMHMDGATALWYVRSRHTSSDLDRLRREQEVVYAIFKKMMTIKVISQWPQMLEEVSNNIQTNFKVEKAVKLAPLALRVFKDPSLVQRYAVGEDQADEMISWNGQWILLPREGEIPKLMKEAGFK